MIARLRVVLLAAALTPPAALGAEPAQGQEPVVLARSMLEVWAPETNEVAGVLIDALDADGAPDPSRLSEEGWRTMAAAVERLREEASAIRTRPIQVVAHPDDKIFGEDTSGLTAADVQGLIDSDRDAFDYFVDLMRDDFDQMDAAIAARDAEALWAISAVLDVKCNACHERFWYPDWREDDVPPP